MKRRNERIVKKNSEGFVSNSEFNLALLAKTKKFKKDNI